MKTQSLVAAELPVERPAPGLLGLAEQGWIPDLLLRAAIRHQCADRLSREQGQYQKLIDLLRDSPIAVHTDSANSQHYEVPAEFFVRCLGPRLKYSCAYYPEGTESLGEAEEKMLQLYGERAGLADGQDILELGCGWGSLTLWMAEHYPDSRITAVSNSNTQRRYIQDQCTRRGLRNVHVITQNVVSLELPARTFDRCVSIEMFEHMRNYGALLHRISTWLKPDGKLFVHIFAHATLAYPFETEGSDNWLGRHFFTGGLMPAADTLLWFQEDMRIEQRWQIDGTHYMRTANHWLQNQDAHRDEILGLFEQTYGRDCARLWLQRWRMFWMACAELFGYRGGREWIVCHYVFTPSCSSR